MKVTEKLNCIMEDLESDLYIPVNLHTLVDLTLANEVAILFGEDYNAPIPYLCDINSHHRFAIC